jgi:hypothetical protein
MLLSEEKEIVMFQAAATMQLRGLVLWDVAWY